MSSKPQTQCPSCTKILTIKSDSLYGKKTHCPKCSNKFFIEPYPPVAEFDEEDLEFEDVEEDFGFEEYEEVEDDFGFSDSGASDDDEFGFGNASGGPIRPKQIAVVKSAEEIEEERARAEHKKHRKKRKKKKVSPAVQIMAWIAGGCVGGLLGAIIWAFLIYHTEREFGIMAWGVGGLVGFGVLSAIQMTGGGTSAGPGIVAAIISIFSIILGKAIGLFFIMNAAFADVQQGVNITIDDIVFRIVSEEVFDELADEENNIADQNFALFQERVEKEAHSRIENATPEQKAEWEQQAQKMKDEMKENMDQAGGALTVFGMLIALLLAVFSVGLLDLLFFFFAVGTAYKLASGLYEAM